MDGMENNKHHDEKLQGKLPSRKEALQSIDKSVDEDTLSKICTQINTSILNVLLAPFHIIPYFITSFLLLTNRKRQKFFIITLVLGMLLVIASLLVYGGTDRGKVIMTMLGCGAGLIAVTLCSMVKIETTLNPAKHESATRLEDDPDNFYID